MRGERGQASAELVAVVPMLAAAVLVAVQMTAAGWALWSAGSAARSGARAMHVGGDGERAAMDSLPGPLREKAEVEQKGPLRVRVQVPRIIPGLPKLGLSAAARLDPLAGDG